ncbi:hypothetical protein MSBR3_0383 [Methanosarcina barkeri 3]|uniref:Uncharacterized protein n=1 Tax=Methanosarcina barkeri 3 TaxID=1434107 RepID=A0A0E3SI69_METBA|nr:hypothetical protein [Methanosarcina barkeri]AKB80961.1 hypothetical protein MSBR3_0383 [Methanosarcina barkeri 3]
MHYLKNESEIEEAMKLTVRVDYHKKPVEVPFDHDGISDISKVRMTIIKRSYKMAIKNENVGFHYSGLILTSLKVSAKCIPLVIG